jgi:hypothetical protein
MIVVLYLREKKGGGGVKQNSDFGECGLFIEGLITCKHQDP